MNSIGDAECRPKYLESLRAYYSSRLDDVCEDCHTRYEKNTLRLLDCKQERCQPVIAGAPTPAEGLCADCEAHFGRVRELLDLWEIPYEITPRLVRGWITTRARFSRCILRLRDHRRRWGRRAIRRADRATWRRADAGVGFAPASNALS